MTVKINVVNKRHGVAGEYIGRPSPLGNPFTSKSHGQGIRVNSVQESINMFDKWLEDKINAGDQPVLLELARLYNIADKQELNLVCWCAPGPCHGDVIKRVLLNAKTKQGNKDA